MYRTESLADGIGGPLIDGAVGDPAPPLPIRSRLGRSLKRAIDIAGATLFLVAGLFVYIVVALGVKLTSPGPIHYWQYRMGRDGRRFRFYKFRSMYVNGDEKLESLLASDEKANSTWQIYQKLPNDPRITSFGRFIRRTSLDELPQIWNVLKGDMSLVGPRPCIEHQRGLYEQYWRTYCSMRPGLTGLWQVSGRNRLSFQERVRLDVRYVQEWSVWLDLKILAKTAKAVISGDGSH